MNEELTELNDLLNTLETSSLEPHGEYSMSFTNHEQTIIWNYIKELWKQVKESKEKINKVLDLIDNHNKLEQELGGTIKFNVVKVENILRGDKK
ncbi:hypothetical protein [uncultured Clostridium sp.]|uniref:hypothetical protein n=1 Tax=uncultured Clostridium sp. TaxID=59620 RepID=UPI00261822F5|nr:hypothetical protein [uncultured Clostridium sp.]